MNWRNTQQWYPLRITGSDWRPSPPRRPPGQVSFLPRGRQDGRLLTTVFRWSSSPILMDAPGPPDPTKNWPLESQNLLVGTR